MRLTKNQNMQRTIKELKPIKESTEDYEKIEQAIIKLLREELFSPILKEMGLPKRTIKNTINDLLDAISSGRIYFDNGKFYGKFDSVISKELRKIGAVWSKDHYAIPQAKLPIDVRNAISYSHSKFQSIGKSIDDKLSKLLPEKIAEKLKISNLFDSTLWKVEEDIQDSVKGITVAPKLSEKTARVISEEYEKNMQLYITDFTKKEIVELRKAVQENFFNGYRLENMVKDIQLRYEVSANKAKFLARQETMLLMSKFKESRYKDAGVNKYIWTCVNGSPNHPVRPMHKALNGKIFSWDNPPVTNEKGERNNPSQDFNCRCFARPVVEW